VITHLLCLAAAGLLDPAPPVTAAQPAGTEVAAPDDPNPDRMAFTADYFASSNPSSAYDMIMRVPGFRLREADAVRGLAGAGGNVLINGAVPASKSESLRSLLERIPADRVERIDLLRGSGRSEVSQVEDVVDVVLTTGVTDWRAVQADAALYTGGPQQWGLRLEASGGADGREWRVQAFRGLYPNDSTGPGWLVRRDGQGRETDREAVSNRFDAIVHGGRLDWSLPVSGGRLETSASATQTDYEDQIVYTGGVNVRRFDFAMALTDLELSANWRTPSQSRPGAEVRFVQTASIDELASVALSGGAPQAFLTERISAETAARLTLFAPVNPALEGEMGGEIAYNLLDAEQSFRVGGVAIALPLATTRVDEVRVNAFLGATWEMAPSLRLEAELRAEASRIRQSGDGERSRDLTYFKPRVALTWFSSDQTRWRFSVSREVGQIDFLDFAASSTLVNNQILAGNDALRPQTLWNATVSFEQRFADSGVISLTLRGERLSDVVDFLPTADGGVIRGNIGDGTLAAAAVELRLPLRRLGPEGARLEVSAAYEQIEVTDPVTGQERGVSYRSPSQTQIRLINEAPAYRVNWGLEYRPYARSPTFDPDQTRFYRTRDQWSVFAEWSPPGGWTMRAEAFLWDDLQIPRTVFAARTLERPVALEELQVFDPRDRLELRLRRAY